MAFWPGQRTCVDNKVFAVGTNAKKVASRALGIYSLVAGQAKWKFRFDTNQPVEHVNCKRRL